MKDWVLKLSLKPRMDAQRGQMAHVHAVSPVLEAQRGQMAHVARRAPNAGQVVGFVLTRTVLSCTWSVYCTVLPGGVKRFALDRWAFDFGDNSWIDGNLNCSFYAWN